MQAEHSCTHHKKKPCMIETVVFYSQLYAAEILSEGISFTLLMFVILTLSVDCSLSIPITTRET